MYEDGITVVVVAISRSTPPPKTNVSMLNIEEQSDPYFVNATLIGKLYNKFYLIVIFYKLAATLWWNDPLKGE